MDVGGVSGCFPRPVVVLPGVLGLAAVVVATVVVATVVVEGVVVVARLGVGLPTVVKSST